jgi:hypothetical protein
MEYVILEPKKPENIAVSFSGGGFRAATFALGCLSYMETLYLGAGKFSSLIRFISSASGGTITNLSYTAYQRKGRSFDEYYRFMTEKILCNSELADRVFEIMQSPKYWKDPEGKSRNLINAFSIAYDELLFEGEQFGLYWNPLAEGVQEVCANTTEFDNGMLFRFQNIPKYGNNFLFFTAAGAAALKKIKLGDILAASSCFPVGFEPIMFPRDFTHANLQQQELQDAIEQNPAFSPVKPDEQPKPKCFGIMDGGIDDNQGIASFMLAEERFQKKNGFGYDLYMACDVSSNYTSGFDFPEENRSSTLQKLSLLQYAVIILLLLAGSLAGILTNTLSAWAYALLGVSGFLSAIIILITSKLIIARQRSVKGKSTFGILLFKRIFFFLRLRLSVVLQMIDSRATSAAYLASVVFLKKIRRMSYDRLYEKISERKLDVQGKPIPDEDGTQVSRVELKHWKRFALQNALYLLSKKNNRQRIKDLEREKWYASNPTVVMGDEEVLLTELMKPSAKLQLVATAATEMDTTLWFDHNHLAENIPAALLAAGQFTTCYNLLRYAFRFGDADEDLKQFKYQLVQDWQKFNEDPFWLYKQWKVI